MAEKQGEISVSRAAQILGIHADTVRGWAKDTLSRGGQETAEAPLRLRYARVDGVGRYFVAHEEILEVKRSRELAVGTLPPRVPENGPIRGTSVEPSSSGS